MTKISIRSDEFFQPISEAFEHGKKVIVWHQIPWSGGMQEWFLIHSISTLDTILSKGRIASAFTAYEWIEVHTSQIVNEIWIEQISLTLQEETRNLMLLIEPVVPNEIEPIQLTWVGEVDDIKKYYEQHIGEKATVGRIPSVTDGELIRGYYPDNDGVPQSGPY
jgi:hypothetical protein